VILLKIMLESFVVTPEIIQHQVSPQPTMTIAQALPSADKTQRSDPNRNRLLPTPQPTLPSPEQQPPVLPAPNPTPAPSPDLPNTPVRKISIVGSTVFQAADFAPLIQPIEGKTVTLADLRRTADSITQIYLNKGYINSRAIVEGQEIIDGIVTIRVVEGSIETIVVEGNQRLSRNYILSRIQPGITQPVRQAQLEEQLRLLRLDPNLKTLQATLQAGSGPGKSILSIRVEEAAAIYAGVSADNFSSPAVGSERLGGYIGLRNPIGLGDEFTFSYNRTTSGGSNAYDLNYRVPINPKNGTLQFRFAPSTYRITDKSTKALYPGLDFRGNAELYEISLRQPILRSLRQELALSLGFALQNGESFIVGTDLGNTNNRTRTLKFGQDYLARDVQGTWGIRSQFNFGLDIFNPTIRANNEADGKFFSWLGQMQRVQRISDSNFLIAQFDLQLSPDALTPSQQFVIGGGQSLRGYRQNARAGDNGLRFSLEDRIAIARNSSGSPVLQLAPFIDLGTVWNNKNTVKQNFLSSGGVGLIWQPIDRGSIRLDYAFPFRSVEERSSNLQDSSLYFSVNYQL
jgi:hemolysin activation/secretion protein